jgi:DNA-binding response OmpR family regulator
MLPEPMTTDDAPIPSLGLILLVEDNQRVSEEISRVLQQAGWRVACASDGEQCRQAIAEQTPTIVVLDLNLPGEDGISLCRWLRSTVNEVGIVLLTARVMGSERTEGYVAGADVYLTKPTRPDELLAVLHNLARRATASSAAGRAAQPSPWTLHLKGMRLVSPQLDILSLTPSECALVRALADASGPCTYEVLIDQLGSGGLNDRTDKAKLEVLVSRLRTKMRNLKAHGLEIKTVHGSGYRLSQALRISAR